MNEITAAIGERAFRIYGSSSNNAAMSYIRGQQDAIGFMLKFVEWVACNYVPVIAMKELKYWQKENYQNKERFYSTEELLKLYMEDNKL